MHPVVGCLAVYNESAVLGVVPAAVERLQVKPELVAAARSQLMKQVVANPQVAFRVFEPDFKLRPRTVEEVQSVDVLLDQRRNTVGYRTKNNNTKLLEKFRNNIIIGPP